MCTIDFCGDFALKLSKRDAMEFYGSFTSELFSRQILIFTANRCLPLQILFHVLTCLTFNSLVHVHMSGSSSDGIAEFVMDFSHMNMRHVYRTYDVLG